MGCRCCGCTIPRSSQMMWLSMEGNMCNVSLAIDLTQSFQFMQGVSEDSASHLEALSASGSWARNSLWMRKQAPCCTAVCLFVFLFLQPQHRLCLCRQGPIDVNIFQIFSICTTGRVILGMNSIQEYDHAYLKELMCRVNCFAFLLSYSQSLKHLFWGSIF